jgi:hypothetical protein
MNHLFILESQVRAMRNQLRTIREDGKTAVAEAEAKLSIVLERAEQRNKWAQEQLDLALKYYKEETQ